MNKLNEMKLKTNEKELDNKLKNKFESDRVTQLIYRHFGSLYVYGVNQNNYRYFSNMKCLLLDIVADMNLSSMSADKKAWLEEMIMPSINEGKNYDFQVIMTNFCEMYKYFTELTLDDLLELTYKSCKLHHEVHNLMMEERRAEQKEKERREEEEIKERRRRNSI